MKKVMPLGCSKVVREKDLVKNMVSSVSNLSAIPCINIYDRGNKAQNKVKVIIDGTTIKFGKVEQLTKF